MSKRKLLLADDSITIQKVVNLTFADEGIEVISVGDGDSAMRKFDEFMPDLVMADVNMPGLNGYEVCRIIKRTEETQNIPVILLVGSFEPFDEREAKDAGADDYLTKPFQSIRQLVNKVTDLLNQRERAGETPAGETGSQPPVVDSFAETLEFEKQEEEEEAGEYGSRREESASGFESQKSEIGSEFGDAGMDDEMIETSPANDYISGSDSAYQGETTIDYGKTQPLNAEDLKGFAIVPGASAEQEPPPTAEDEEPAGEAEQIPERPEAASFDEEARKLGVFAEYDERGEKSEVISETEPEIDYYLPSGGTENEEEFEKEMTDAETLAPEVSYAPQEPREADFSEAPNEEPDETEQFADEASRAAEEEESEKAEAFRETEEDYAERPRAERETFDEVEAVRDMERDYNERSEAETAVTAEAEEPQRTESVQEAPVSAATDVPSLSFDDGDLLELPPLVEETGIRPQPKIQPVAAPEPEPVKAEAATEAEAAETETPETALEAGAMQSFPPELIEAIAQKVAEKISAKTMSDVLPQITELVMKKMAEEKKE